MKRVGTFFLLATIMLSSCGPSVEESARAMVVHTRTPTAKPQSTDTAAPVPSHTAAAAVEGQVATPTPLAKRPADAIATYWSLVSNRDYVSAWRLLSDRFRQRKHGGDFPAYQNGYQEMKLCSVEPSRIKAITESGRNARVSSRITYRMGDACDNQVDFDFEFYLIRETPETGWQIDKVTSADDLDVSLDGVDNCGDSTAAVLASSLNVRTGPGAGRTGEASYRIKSYLQRGECVRATATDVDRSWVLIADAPRAAAEGGWVAVSFLEFGDAANAIEGLPVVAMTPPPPTLTPPPNVEWSKPIGIEHLGGANYVCYNIQGSNSDQLTEQMDILGPFTSDGEEAWAVTSLAYEASGGSCYSDGTADLSDVRVDIDATITMPCWYPQSDTSHVEVSTFERFMRTLSQHELRHVEIAWQHASIFEQQLRDANTCDDAIIGRIEDQVWVDYDAAQNAFHASPAGQAIRYP